MDRLRYLVVSYDTDQQQWFYDWVLAGSADEARTFICEARPYVVASDAILDESLAEMASDLSGADESSIESEMNALKAEVKS